MYHRAPPEIGAIANWAMTNDAEFITLPGRWVAGLRCCGINLGLILTVGPVPDNE